MAQEIISENNFRRAALVCSAVTAGLAAAAIMGWLLNMYTLARIRPEYIPMAPSTALAFIITGIALLIRILYPLSHYGKLIIRIASAFVISASSIIIIQFIANLKIDVEKIFISTPEMLGHVPVGRMSPITAISFFLVSAAILLFSLRPGRRFVEWIAAVFSTLEVSISMIVLLGYLYGVPILYGGYIIPVAYTTAISFVSLGLGVLFTFGIHLWPVSSLTGPSTQARLLRAFLPFVVVLILFEGWLDTIVLSETRTNPALNSALIAIASSLVIIIIISRIARTIGADIDRAEKSLTESEKKYRNLVDNALVGVYRATLDGRFLYVNDALAGIFECVDAGEMLSAPVWTRYKSPADRKGFLEALQKDGKVSSYELEVPTSTGNLKNIVVSAVLEGNIISGMVVDITGQKKLEDQLRQSQKIEAIGTFAGGIAHDFNNILTAIIGYGNFLQRKMKIDDPLRPNVEQILASAERATNLTHSLLAFNRKQVSNPVPVNLNEITKRIEKFLIRIIGEDIELKTAIANKDLAVMIDPGQIEQVLMNLATNARDAMPKGGFLTIETGIVEIDEEYIKTHGYGKAGIYALMSVTDSGIGMDEKTKENIFEPFFTTKEVGKGSGLGLSIVYGIIKQHNGYINCYSESGKGTTFRIYLPLIKSEEVKEIKPAEPVAPICGTETILLVEDEERVRKVTREVLEEFGYKVIEAKDGEEAMNKFIEFKDKIYLLLLDVIMPKMNGKEVYDKIKKFKPDIKTLFTSGYPADLIRKEDIFEKGLEFISKPISPISLLKKVREVLDK